MARLIRQCGPARRRSRSQAGAVAVEFALVLPLLIMLLLGITTAGLSYTRAIGLTNAVREGARFGATADATDDVAWSADVADRLRTTQFDDDTVPAQSGTSICVQLWKKTGAGTGTELAGVCSQGKPGASPTVSMPSASSAPDVPANLPVGACVVRVVAARNFTINLGLVKWDRVNSSASVARYERTDVVDECAVTA